VAADKDIAGTYGQSGGHHADGCCFAGPVWPKQPENFSSFDGKIDTVNGNSTVKNFAQIMDFNKGSSQLGAPLFMLRPF
jgi:hypothetical protein